ncbi:hypothetical protein [Nostoc sp. FACHB-280]|uniref:hypothetical protein n=1 Tax=Nostoc sp. FACHB-280 TaxID=2692839 RepID=UPI00168ADAA7|nr:hypothetical protein [Nostoc sp. FACHB-280]MBD2497641.1 hypothetical protein [Nostoc sp. FACHB-280]
MDSPRLLLWLLDFVATSFVAFSRLGISGYGLVKHGKIVIKHQSFFSGDEVNLSSRK